jgi:hypothetical protein
MLYAGVDFYYDMLVVAHPSPDTSQNSCRMCDSP